MSYISRARLNQLAAWFFISLYIAILALILITWGVLIYKLCAAFIQQAMQAAAPLCIYCGGKLRISRSEHLIYEVCDSCGAFNLVEDESAWESLNKSQSRAVYLAAAIAVAVWLGLFLFAAWRFGVLK